MVGYYGTVQHEEGCDAPGSHMRVQQVDGVLSIPEWATVRTHGLFAPSQLRLAMPFVVRLVNLSVRRNADGPSSLLSPR